MFIVFRHWFKVILISPELEPTDTNTNYYYNTRDNYNDLIIEMIVVILMPIS